MHTLRNIEEFKIKVDSGLTKTTLSKEYNVSIPVINRWLKENDIEMFPYQGTSVFKSIKEKDIVNEKIKTLSDQGYNYSKISNILNIPRRIVTNICGKNTNQFNKWQKELDYLKQNLCRFEALNKSMTLKDIAAQENISVEQLKRVFKESNILVTLHSYNKSKGELEVRDYIEDRGFECLSKIFSVNGIRKEIDCFVSDLNYGVEYCGEYWHSGDEFRHEEKRKFFEELNIFVCQIFETEWLNKKLICQSIINHSLGLANKIPFTECEIRIIDNDSAQKFHINNNIKGSIEAEIHYGLVHNDHLIMLLSINKNEIVRKSNMLNTSVDGGLCGIVKYTEISDMIIHSDLRFDSKDCYLKENFELIEQSKPNKLYFDKSKSAFVSEKLDKNCLEIWDCGYIKWKYKGGN